MHLLYLAAIYLSCALLVQISIGSCVIPVFYRSILGILVFVEGIFLSWIWTFLYGLHGFQIAVLLFNSKIIGSIAVNIAISFVDCTIFYYLIGSNFIRVAYYIELEFSLNNLLLQHFEVWFIFCIIRVFLLRLLNLIKVQTSLVIGEVLPRLNSNYMQWQLIAYVLHGFHLQ